METKELINRLSERADSTKADAKIFMQAFLEVLTEALAEGESIKLRGFGNFDVNTRKQCSIKHPKTGEPSIIPEHKIVKFTMGGKLKQIVNEDLEDMPDGE